MNRIYFLLVSILLFSLSSWAQDFLVTSYPYTNSSTTCGAADDCNLRGQEEEEYEIAVTVAGNYTFSTCNSAFNTHIYLGSTQCTQDLGNDNNSCPNPNGAASTLTVTLAIGNYWLTVEGRQNNSCGAYTLDITGPPPPPIENDLCANAIAVTCPSTTAGTTVGASPETLGTCVTTDGTGGAVWYSFTGTGDDITASLCTNTAYDSKIRVFTGSCGALICETGNDDSINCPGNESEVTFTSVNGTIYFILVHGFLGNEGTFELAITCTTPTSGDDCATATTVFCGNNYAGTTVGMGVDNPPFCGTGDGTGGGVWYEFTGNGDQVTASLCTNTNYDSKIRLFTGTCSALVCEAGNDDLCGVQSEVTFTSVASTTYYILVHGFGGSEGDYELALTCTSVGSGNEDCSSAQPIACGATVSGTTVGTSNDIAPFCGTGDGTGGGVWYEFTGTGDQVTASLCTNTNYDSKIRVFTGTCGALVCEAGNDDLCGVQSEVTFTSVASTTYYILVHGFGGSEGNYELAITCVPTGPSPQGSDCADPIALNAGSLPYDDLGENTGTYGDDYSTSPCDDFYMGGDEVVYTYTAGATDELMDISVVFTDSWGGVHVLNDCPDIATTCIASDLLVSAGTASIPCLTVPAGTTYYIVISTFPSPQTTGYDLSITACTLPNDVCTGAQAISCNQVISGSTVAGANPDTAPTCSGVSDGTGNGVWYVYTGTGEDVTASLCGSSFDTRIRVFTGTCGALSCLVGNDDLIGCGDGSQSSVTFTSVLGTTYYILVDGATATDVGDFTLSLTCFSENQGGDDCANATLVTCDNTYVGDTSLDLITDNTPSCNSTDNGTGGGVWYYFVGNGDYITASLCGSSFDTRIRIYEGTCASLTCVTGNDDFGGCAQTNNSQVNFQSVNGTTYYILVHGSGNEEGLFSLTLTCNSLAFTTGDCRGAQNTCESVIINPLAPDAGNYPNELNTSNQGCLLGGENKTKWFLIRTLPGPELPGGSGDCLLEFTVSTDASTDYDFAVWGPYSSSSNACQGLADGDDPARCSFSGTNGNTGLDSSISGGDITEGAGGNKWVDGILADGEELYIMCIDNWSQNTVSFGLTFPQATSDCLDCVVLPIELLSFNGYALSGKNILQWTTAVEINNDYFTIERSHDSFDFHPIGTMSGAGNSSQPLSYSMVDDDPLPGTNYYRLKQTDFDGSSKTFHTIAIDSDDPIQEFTLFPNPGSDVVTVITSERDIERETFLTIHDAKGFIVEQLALNTRHMRFDVSHLATGMYLVKMTNDRATETLTFIKH